MKIRSEERAEIRDVDILELIPGHHFFKYQVMIGNRNNDRNVITLVSGGTSNDEVQCYNGKRSRKHSEDHVPDKKGRNKDNDCEFIHHFNASKQLLPMIFRFLQVQGLLPWANTFCVSIDDVIQDSEGDSQAVRQNYPGGRRRSTQKERGPKFCPHEDEERIRVLGCSFSYSTSFDSSSGSCRSR